MALIDRSTQLRLRRFFRRRRRNLERAAENVDDSFENNVLNRFSNVAKVWRFVLGWAGLVAILTSLAIVQTFGLANLYQKKLPVAGGVYNEGLLGSFSNINPLYTTSSVDEAASRLVFAGLMKLDSTNTLVPDLAEKLDIDQVGKNYTVTLKNGLKWHDGKPLTADDVVFTYKLIQNPNADSILKSSWRDVTITKIDKRTVRFSLPSTLAPFKYSLTTGLVPKHILEKIPANELRANPFNTVNPIGAGPYKWVGLDLRDAASEDETSVLAFAPFDDYHQGRPSLERFLIHTYNNEKGLAKAFENNKIMAASGLTETPDSFKLFENIRTYAFRNTAELMVFFKTTEGVLADSKVRQALVYATARNDLARKIPSVYRPVNSPLLPGQVGYDKSFDQAPHSTVEAQRVLDEAGWKVAEKGIRHKDGKPLMIRLYAEDTPVNQKIVASLKKNWTKVGVDLRLEVQEKANFQTTLNFHTYDALLYGISIGPDPDVYAYWHSTQADVRSSSRLNFSEYKSKTADLALEGGRTRVEPDIRKTKYQPFLKAWKEDAPAVALFQPRQFYYVHGNVYGLKEGLINTDSDRYSNVANWKIHTAGVTVD